MYKYNISVKHTENCGQTDPVLHCYLIREMFNVTPYTFAVLHRPGSHTPPGVRPMLMCDEVGLTGQNVLEMIWRALRAKRLSTASMGPVETERFDQILFRDRMAAPQFQDRTPKRTPPVISTSWFDLQ